MVYSKQYVVEYILCRCHSWCAFVPYIVGCVFFFKQQCKLTVHAVSTLVRVLDASNQNTFALV